MGRAELRRKEREQQKQFKQNLPVIKRQITSDVLKKIDSQFEKGYTQGFQDGYKKACLEAEERFRENFIGNIFNTSYQLCFTIIAIVLKRMLKFDADAIGDIINECFNLLEEKKELEDYTQILEDEVDLTIDFD